MSMKPMRIRKARPSIWMVGCLLTKLPTGVAKAIMISTDNTTATTMMNSAPDRPLVMPTAVRMESKENTRLISVI